MNCALAIIMPNFSYGHDASCPYITKMILQKKIPKEYNWEETLNEIL
ncbi:hypothetical protein ES707_10394 [subsurface metagenome]